MYRVRVVVKCIIEEAVLKKRFLSMIRRNYSSLGIYKQYRRVALILLP